MSFLDWLMVGLCFCLAVDVAAVVVLSRRYDDDEFREQERRRVCAELEAAERKPYRVIGGSRRGPERVTR